MPIIIPDNLPYSPRGIECLRFGARRGGEGIGCCAVDVIQGFGNDPASVRPPIPFFDGDSWSPIEADDGSQLHLTGTNEEIFKSYLVHGSFTNDPVADHAFIAILSDEQCRSETGKAWLKILYAEGFNYVGTVNNSVYYECHPNHIFILIRNTHEILTEEEHELLGPPEYWQELSEGAAATAATRKTPEARYYALKEEGYGRTRCFTSACDSSVAA